MRLIMATTLVDRCKQLEDKDSSLSSLKLIISSYSAALPTLTALARSSQIRELFVTTPLSDEEVGRLCNEVLLQNTSLERVTLDLTECSDQGAVYLAKLIKETENIKWISLLLNNVGEKGASYLAEALRCSKLCGFSIYATQLDLHDRCIGDAGTAILSDAFRSCSEFLSSICIAQSGVTGVGLDHILGSLSENGNITSLDLHSNRIDKDGAIKLATFLSSDTSGDTCKLQQLILDENHSIGSDGAKSLALSLKDNKSLKYLSLKSCTIGRKGAERFATTLSQNQCLKELILCGNVDIGDDAVELISRGLKQNASLCKLDLSSCGIGDEGCSHLSDVLMVNDTLTHLSLHSNEIGDGGAIALSGALSKKSVLTSLILTKNRFGEKGSLALLQCLHQNISLTTLAMDAPLGRGIALKEKTMVDILLGKNKQLLRYRRKTRELAQKNVELTKERDYYKAESEKLRNCIY